MRGFTLVEICIVMVISGFLLITFLGMLEQSQQGKIRTEIDDKFDLVRLAMTHYTFDEPGKDDPVRFPCPASLTLSPSDEKYGFEMCPWGDDPDKNMKILKRMKAGGDLGGVYVLESMGDEPVASKASGARSFVYQGKKSGLKEFVLVGAIPAVTLEIPLDTMIDPYDSRFLYAVTLTLTEKGALLKKPVPSGAIKIINEADADITSTARFFVLSSGSDRAGSYTTAGRAYGTQCRKKSGGDARNCQWRRDNLAVFRTRSGFSHGANDNYFDDWTMSQMFSQQDVSGWWQSEDESGDNIVMKNKGAVIIGDGGAEEIEEGDRLIVDGNIRTKRLAIENEDSHDAEGERLELECEKKTRGIVRYKQGVLEFCNGQQWKKIITGGFSCDDGMALKGISSGGSLQCIPVLPPG
ncbi:MAG: hypothetical protein DHS20C02_04690 [Micavibrio sp.]|nr:MAG: hypothetical protein DHS20C02_04690 [Micavibrio sp.]